jgi:hypothetical protein
MAVVLIVVGATWILQGLNLLRGSIMSGRTTFSLLGSVLVVIGGLILVRVRRGTGR